MVCELYLNFQRKIPGKKVYVHTHMYTRTTETTYMDLISKIKLFSQQKVDEARITTLNLVQLGLLKEAELRYLDYSGRNQEAVCDPIGGKSWVNLNVFKYPISWR